jgi:hypothetical protein
MRDEAYYADNFQEAYRLGIDVLQLAESLSAADGLLVADSKVRIAMILDKLDRTAEAATNYEEACPVFLAKASDEDTRPGLCQHAQAMALRGAGHRVFPQVYGSTLAVALPLDLAAEPLGEAVDQPAAWYRTCKSPNSLMPKSPSASFWLGMTTGVNRQSGIARISNIVRIVSKAWNGLNRAV